jgi:hypothetical protein
LPTSEDPNTITVARFRAAAELFRPEAATVLRRCREAGLIPAGRRGRNGVGSARLTVHQVALLAIALAAPVVPLAVAEATVWIADFRLRALDRAIDRGIERRHIDHLSGMRFGEFLAAEIGAARGQLQNYSPIGWRIEGNEVWQRSVERLVFSGAPRDYSIMKAGIIPGPMVRELAGLFPPLPHSATAPKLMAAVAAIAGIKQDAAA